MNPLIKYMLGLCFMASTQLTFCQTTGIPFTANYEAEIHSTHVQEKDQEGNITKATFIATGNGMHSLLGDVSVFSIVHFDSSTGDNVIEFTETDADGNSLFIKTKAVPAENGAWKCYSAILGGTGKYKTASGHYVATGSSDETSSAWTAEGILFYSSEEDEMKAIKQVIAEDTKAFYKNDMESWSNIQLAADYNGGIYVLEPGAALMQRGQEFRQTIESYPRPETIPKVERSNWDIQVRGEVAWASFTQKTHTHDGVSNSIESRVLEKINGDWKIVFNTVAFHN